jgi:hypothetical protein
MLWGLVYESLHVHFKIYSYVLGRIDLQESFDALKDIQIYAQIVCLTYTIDATCYLTLPSRHFCRAFWYTEYLCRGCQHLTHTVRGDTNTPFQGYQCLVYQQTCQGDTNTPFSMYSVKDTYLALVSSHIFSATDTCDKRFPSQASLSLKDKQILSLKVTISHADRWMSHFASYLYHIGEILKYLLMSKIFA